MGSVYRARDPRLDRIVAIKVIRSDFAQRPDLEQRFSREARVISSLNHPNICSIHDFSEQDGSVYLVMEFVEGQTLTTALQQGPVSPDLAIRYGIEIAGALSAAHAKGIIHRDLKPGNIMIAESGVKVLDFGLAKRVDHAGAWEQQSTVTMQAETEAGQILGTLAYMSPEQAEGKPLDARSDVFSLGIVLYEMLTGKRPFEGTTPLSTLAAVLREEPAPPRELMPQIPRHVEAVILRCLEKDPAARYPSAEQVHRELSQDQAVPARSSGGWIKGAIAACALLAAAAGVWAYVRASRVRWAEKEALPEIAGLLAKNELLSALPIFQKARDYAPTSRALAVVAENLYVLPVTIETSPPGADISVADYDDTGGTRWVSLGQSPLRTTRIPFRGYYRIKAVKNGFEPVENVLGVGGGQDLSLVLHTAQQTPTGMVWVPGGGLGLIYNPRPAGSVEGFWIDKYEVTNRSFKQFVDAGGYEKPEFWSEPFNKDGHTISWQEAMALFKDGTGRPGPATWQLGSYPDGKADFPVGGVSWYEAEAYAKFAGKSLPTLYHWARAASPGFFSDIVGLSNFATQGPLAAGTKSGLAPFGAYDMAGNVKEWVENPIGGLRYILGGAWDEPGYQFVSPDARPPMDRAPDFGFRCAEYASPPAKTLLGEVTFESTGRLSDKPVDYRTFAVFQDLHRYEKTPLKPKIESIDDSTPYMRREDVTFQAAYGDERVLAHLYLPKNAAPPFQTVLFFGSGTMTAARSVSELHDPFEFIVRSGRALVLPAYKGTLERGPMPVQVREAMLEWSKDLGRTIDYLETRPDIDPAKFGFYGISFGAGVSPRLIAMEPRIKAVLLVSGGTLSRLPAEVDPWNFAPHVTVPVLMLNGRDDFVFPVETSQNPLFRALGTPEKDKKHVLYDGGHVDLMSRLDLVKDALDWFDHYLGPVKAKP